MYTTRPCAHRELDVEQDENEITYKQAGNRTGRDHYHPAMYWERYVGGTPAAGSSTLKP